MRNTLFFLILLTTFCEAKPAILVATLPKSGTAYICQALCQTTHLQAYREADPLPFPFGKFENQNFDQLMSKGCVIVNHYPPTEENIERISRYMDRVIVHIRDPRECVLSVVHHVAIDLANHYDEEKEVARTVGLSLVYPDYYKLNLEQKIDWHIDHFIPNAVSWIEHWLEFIDQQDKIKVLVTSYSDLRECPFDFFSSILAFSRLSREKLKTKHLPMPEKGKLHYRKGDSQEWRAVLTAEQQRRATALIPEHYFQRFGWVK